MRAGVVSLSSIAGADSGIVRERPFQLLLLINVLPPLGTALLSPVLGSLVEPLGASTANVGLMMSAFTAPSIVVIPIAGVISDRYGRRPVLLFGLVWFGLTGTAIAFVSTFAAALALRALQGIGFAALTPIIITSLGDLYAGTKEATAQGLRFTGSGLSQTAFPLAAGVLVGMAWQYPFLLYAVAFPIAAVVYRYFEEPLDEGDDESADGEGSGRAGATATPVVMGAAVAVATGPLGFEAAVRAVGVGTGLLGAGVGIACLLLMSASPPIRMEGEAAERSR